MTEAAAATAVIVPARPLRHRKKSLLSSGSFGRVFVDTEDAKSVYKQSLLFPPLASQRQLDEIGCTNVEDALSASDLRELVFYSQWTHPALASLRGAAFAGTRPHMDLHMARGGKTLDAYARAPLAQWRAWMKQSHMYDIVRQAAQLLVALAKRDLVHGDLKPLNLLYDNATRRLCVIDWGAYILRPHIRDPHELECTFLYEPPESLQGDALTPPGAFDIWSLGMSLLTLLLGREPTMGVDLSGEDARDDLARVYRTHARAGHVKVAFSTHSRDLVPLPAARAATIADAVPHSALLLELVSDMLTLDPRQRITAAQILTHPWLLATRAQTAAAEETVKLELQPTPALVRQLATCPTTTQHVQAALARHGLTWAQRATAIDQLLTWATFDDKQKALVAGVHIWDRYIATPSAPNLRGDTQRYLWFGQLCQVLAVGVLLNYQTDSLALLRERFPRLQRRTHLDLACVIEHLEACLMLPSAHHDHASIDSVEMRQARPNLARTGDDEDGVFNWTDLVSFARLAKATQADSYYQGGASASRPSPPSTPQPILGGGGGGGGEGTSGMI
jgi:hypothetical protein